MSGKAACIMEPDVDGFWPARLFTKVPSGFSVKTVFRPLDIQVYVGFFFNSSENPFLYHPGGYPGTRNKKTCRRVTNRFRKIFAVVNSETAGA